MVPFTRLPPLSLFLSSGAAFGRYQLCSMHATYLRRGPPTHHRSQASLRLIRKGLHGSAFLLRASKRHLVGVGGLLQSVNNSCSDCDATLFKARKQQHPCVPASLRLSSWSQGNTPTPRFALEVSCTSWAKRSGRWRGSMGSRCPQSWKPPSGSMRPGAMRSWVAEKVFFVFGACFRCSMALLFPTCQVRVSSFFC